MLSCTFAGHRNLFLPDADRKIETALDGLIDRSIMLGSMFGGFFGIALMCMLQINRRDDYDDEEEWE